MVTVWESVCRTSVTVVKAYRNFVEQMPDHDDLLQSVCWTVTGRGRLRYFALCSCVYKYHILAAPSPHVWFPGYMWWWLHCKHYSHMHMPLLQVAHLITCHSNGVEYTLTWKKLERTISFGKQPFLCLHLASQHIHTTIY